MLVPVKDIKVKKRVRKDLGDIDALTESLTKYGLLTPIIINKKNELVAGGRRLEAAKRLGWEQIEVFVIDNVDKLALLEMELEENIQRSDFTASELANGYTALEKLRNPGISKRIWNGIKRFFSFISISDAESTKEQKIKRAKGFLIFLPVGIILTAAGALLAKQDIITSVLHCFMDIVSVVLLICGLIGVVKLVLLRRKA